MRRRSSSDPWKNPLSQAARQVTITGTAPPLERAGHVRPVDGVEAHLDDVGAGCGVAILPDFAHRAAGDGHTQL